MSTTTPETSPPEKVTDPVPLTASGPPAETAPSVMLAEGPGFARMVGFIGLFLLVLGAVVIIANRALTTPRWISEGWGFMFAAAGLALMLYHAIADGEQEVRRMYGGFALFWILFGLVASLVPGPFGDAGAEKAVGFYLLPWGVGAGLVGLLFTIPFSRHETDETYRNAALMLLLSVGAALAVGSVAVGIFQPEFLAGKGVTLAVLGLAFLCAYLGQVDTSDGPGFLVAFTLGAFGAGVVLYAIGRAAFPTLLFEGPGTLRLPNGSLDVWKVAFRVLWGVAFLVPAILALAVRSPGWLKAVTGLVGLVGAGVVVTSLFASPLSTAPRPFLVPNGLILTAIGLLYLTVSLGVCSDSQFVTLTRRELAAYFTSPIGYLVIGGMALILWNQYRIFTNILIRAGNAEMPLPEPIVGSLFINFLPVFAILFEIPLLTMRLVAEERRSGSLEVLLTAPVNEWPVVLSKFLATWIFFLITWLPLGLFLISLRLEVPVPFDYRPVLSFYLCLAAQGLAFVGLGLFFSTLTKNQIIAGVLSLVVMVGFFVCYQYARDPSLPPFLQTVVTRLSFVHMWFEAVEGRLPLRDCLLFASLGVLGLFLSVKVLETRKWS